MGYFDEKFHKREKKYRGDYDIDDSLYVRLDQLSTVYDATITDLVNASLEHLIESEKISLYKKADNDFSVTHTLLIRESNLAGLEELKAKYGVSIYKLVNIAIRNALDES